MRFTCAATSGPSTIEETNRSIMPMALRCGSLMSFLSA
jgi:hypothetical protein